MARYLLDAFRGSAGCVLGIFIHHRGTQREDLRPDAARDEVTM
jgi:hypothetical protein